MDWAKERAVQDIADYYGLDSQLNILQEECGELVQAVSKYRRTKDRTMLIEELADVEIMITQVAYLLRIAGHVSEMEGKKIMRQKKRIQEEEEERIESEDS